MRSKTALAAVVILALAVGAWLGSAASTSARAGNGEAFIVLYDDGSWSYAAQPSSTATTPPSATSAPSRTPSMTPTATHTATASSTPTNTIMWVDTATPPPTWTASPVPSATDVFPTPTPIVETPAPTQATTVPTDEPPSSQTCEVSVVIAALNVRERPITEADILANAYPAKIGVIYQPARYAVQAVEFVWFTTNVNRVDEWAQIELENGRSGWIAINYDGAQYAAYPDEDLCLDVRYPPPETSAADVAGLHLLNVGYDRVQQVGPVGTVKTAYWSSAGAQWKADHPDGTWVHRSMLIGSEMRDCPTDQEWYTPELYAARWAEHWLPAADYQEFMNECGPPGGNDWAQFVKFTIRVMDYAAQRGVCTLWGSFGPGNPDYPAWEHLVEIIEHADENPCGTHPDGTLKYHNIAWHQTMLMPPEIARGAWVLNPHVSRRHQYIDALVEMYTGAGLADHPSGRVWLTEYGLSDGYSGSWDDTFNCEEVARSFWYSAETLPEEAPYIEGFHEWTWGDGGGAWTDNSVCAEQIRALAPG